MRSLLVIGALGLVLLASLGAKGRVFVKADSEAPPDAVLEVQALLASEGFAVTIAPPDTAPVWVTGSAGACALRAAAVWPQGWSRSIVTALATGQRRLYAFEGRVYDDQPELATNLAEYRQRLMRYFGFDAPPPLVLAIIVAPDCPDGAAGTIASLAALTAVGTRG